MDPKDRLLELEMQAIARRQADIEREISNNTYAIKLVEYIVFGLVAVITLAVIGALVALVVK